MHFRRMLNYLLIPTLVVQRSEVFQESTPNHVALFLRFPFSAGEARILPAVSRQPAAPFPPTTSGPLSYFPQIRLLLRAVRSTSGTIPHAIHSRRSARTHLLMYLEMPNGRKFLGFPAPPRLGLQGVYVLCTTETTKPPALA